MLTAPLEIKKEKSTC